MRGWRALLCAASGLAFAAGAHAEAPDKWASWTPPVADSFEDATPATPALWVVRDEDSTLYLFGTMHVRRDDDLGALVERAMGEADEVWTEMDISPAAQGQAALLTMSLGFDPQRTLDSYLSPKQQRRLANELKRLNLQAAMVANMRPWLASMMISMAPMIQNGFDPQAGADSVITESATARGQTRRFFETAEEQMHFFADMGEEAQRASLVSAIYGGGDELDLAKRMENAWSGGDAGAISRLVAEMLRTEPETYKTLLAARNWRWMRVLVRELEGAGVDFVAVGAGHMVGPEGLVSRLRERGYIVTRLSE